MRKIITSTSSTLDGFMDEPHLCSMQCSDEESQGYAFTMTTGADVLLLGRTTYEGMAQAWPTTVFASGAVVHTYRPASAAA